MYAICLPETLAKMPIRRHPKRAPSTATSASACEQLIATLTFVGTSGRPGRERAGRRGGKTPSPHGGRAGLKPNRLFFASIRVCSRITIRFPTFAYVLNTWSHAHSQQTSFVVVGAPLSSWVPCQPRLHQHPSHGFVDTGRLTPSFRPPSARNHTPRRRPVVLPSCLVHSISHSFCRTSHLHRSMGITSPL